MIFTSKMIASRFEKEHYFYRLYINM